MTSMTSVTSAGRPNAGLWPRLAPAARRRGGAGVLVALGFCALVLLVQRFDAPVVLVAAAALACAVPLLLWPELATLLTVLLLYLNVPAILTKRHGVPVAAAGALILLLGLPLLHALFVRREEPRGDTALRVMLAYLGVVVVSALGARDPAVALEYAQRFVLEGIMVYWLVLNAVRSRATLRRVVWTVVAAGSLLGALTAYQEVTGSFRQEFGGLAERNFEFTELRALDRDDPEVRERLQAFAERSRSGDGRAQRANGPMDEPNRFGQILVVLLPLALFCYRVGRGVWTRLAAALAGGLILCGVMFSHSRGAFVTALGLVALAGYIRWIPRSHLLAGALAALLLAPLVAPRVVARVASIASTTSLVESGAGASADGAIKARAAAMLAAANVFMDHPVLGVGAGQFKPFYSARYQEKDPRHAFREAQDFYAHSLYLQLAAELGVVGLAVFLAIFAVLLRDLDRARRRWRVSHPESAELATALLFAILGYLGTSVFLHIGFQRYLWLLAALAGAALHLLRGATPVATPAAAR